MGRLQAEEMAERTDLDTALRWHIQYNHYPAPPLSLVETAKKAIEVAQEGVIFESDWYDELVDMPPGIAFRGRTDGKAPAGGIVEALHLDSFIEWSEELLEEHETIDDGDDTEEHF
jgi:hypothetical protein